MVYLSLKGQAFKKITMDIDPMERSELELENTTDFDIKYSDDRSSCLARLKQEVRAKDDPSRFTVVVELLADFSCEGIETAEDKKTAHIQAYTLIFPYVQNMISQMVVSAGLPPLMIEMLNMKPEEINVK